MAPLHHAALVGSADITQLLINRKVFCLFVMGLHFSTGYFTVYINQHLHSAFRYESHISQADVHRLAYWGRAALHLVIHAGSSLDATHD